MTSDWERAERSARLDHIARLFARGASVSAIRDAMPEASETDLSTGCTSCCTTSGSTTAFGRKTVSGLVMEP